MTESEPLWTWKDVAAYLQASRSWVYKSAEAGVLPSLRIGGLLRFDPARVRAFAMGEPQGVARIVPMPRRPK